MVDGALFGGADPAVVIGAALDDAGRDAVVEMLAQLAHERVRGKAKKQSEAGLAVEAMTGALAPVYLPDAKDDQRHLSTALVQFAFFGAGRRAGVVDFTHPILADYLAALHAVAVLSRAAEAAATSSALSRLALLKGAVHEAFGAADSVAGSVFERTVQRAVRQAPVLQRFLDDAASVIGEARIAIAIGRIRG
jgi:hypothetical protein